LCLNYFIVKIICFWPLATIKLSHWWTRTIAVFLYNINMYRNVKILLIHILNSVLTHIVKRLPEPTNPRNVIEKKMFEVLLERGRLNIFQMYDVNIISGIVFKTRYRHGPEWKSIINMYSKNDMLWTFINEKISKKRLGRRKIFRIKSKSSQTSGKLGNTLISL